MTNLDRPPMRVSRSVQSGPSRPPTSQLWRPVFDRLLYSRLVTALTDAIARHDGQAAVDYINRMRELAPEATDGLLDALLLAAMLRAVDGRRLDLISPAERTHP